MPEFGFRLVCLCRVFFSYNPEVDPVLVEAIVCAAISLRLYILSFRWVHCCRPFRQLQSDFRVWGFVMS